MCFLYTLYYNQIILLPLCFTSPHNVAINVFCKLCQKRLYIFFNYIIPKGYFTWFCVLLFLYYIFILLYFYIGIICFWWCMLFKYITKFSYVEFSSFFQMLKIFYEDLKREGKEFWYQDIKLKQTLDQVSREWSIRYV